MQTSEDGEYIPSKELKTNFKIPKKLDNNNVADKCEPREVLGNSYYNLGEVLAQPPPPPPPPSNESAPSATLPAFIPNKLVLDILENCEKPKNYTNHVLKETIPDCFDSSLPRELVCLFQPLYCKLCSTQLSSNSVAKLHYKSKNHEKKIRQFLINFSEQTGEPLHKRAKLSASDKKAEECPNPLYFHCDVCDLPLTGKMHAESHYSGRNHRKAILGLKNPAGKGFRNKDGKWIRENPFGVKLPTTTVEGDDGFGKDFHTMIGPQPVGPTSPFICSVCNVTTTCREQLESHYNGQKHQKKLKRLNLAPDVVHMGGSGTPTASSESPTSPPNDNILASVVSHQNSLKFVDSSIFRTPSGQYYCPTCNTTQNSEIQFKQHMQSKSHLKKSIAKK